MPDDPNARAMLRRHPAYEPSSPLPPPPRAPATDSVIAKAERMPLARLLVLVAAATTGLAGVITATGAAVVSVVDAVAAAKARPANVEIDRRLDAFETRINGDFGLKLETETRQKKQAETDERIDRLRSDLDALKRERDESPRRRR